MTPSADSASPSARLESVAAERLLDDGELILLAIKPSGWFVLLVSWPVLVPAALLVAAAWVLNRFFPAEVPGQVICLLCLAGACGRLVIACAQWVGHLYLLTNRRVLRVRGMARVHIDECPLRRIHKTLLSAAVGERLLGLGTLMFEDAEGRTLETVWACLSQPGEVRDAVEAAIRRAR